MRLASLMRPFRAAPPASRSNQEVQMVLWAHAAVRRPPPPALAAALDRLLCARLAGGEPIEPHQLASVLRGWHVSGAPPPSPELLRE
eukprot:162349-Prorocentrum_minimum.AAC.1